MYFVHFWRIILVRQSTVMDQCGLLALTLPTGFRSTITLREAAKEADR